MKKLLTGLSLILFIFTTQVMAAALEGKVSTQSLNAALEARNAAFQVKLRTSPTATKAQVIESLVNYDTYIDVYNFTDYSLSAGFANLAPVPITAQTAARYDRQNYTGYTEVRLFNAYNQLIWDNFVQYHDRISVYININGQYLVYVSH